MFLPVFPSVFHFRLAGPPQPCSLIFLFILQCSTSDLSWTSSTLLLSGFSFRYIRWSPSTCQTQSVLLKIHKITVMITRKRTRWHQSETKVVSSRSRITASYLAEKATLPSSPWLYRDTSSFSGDHTCTPVVNSRTRETALRIRMHGWHPHGCGLD
jgi:hypothetical protein